MRVGFCLWVYYTWRNVFLLLCVVGSGEYRVLRCIVVLIACCYLWVCFFLCRNIVYVLCIFLIVCMIFFALLLRSLTYVTIVARVYVLQQMLQRGWYYTIETCLLPPSSSVVWDLLADSLLPHLLIPPSSVTFHWGSLLPPSPSTTSLKCYLTHFLDVSTLKLVSFWHPGSSGFLSAVAG